MANKTGTKEEKAKTERKPRIEKGLNAFIHKQAESTKSAAKILVEVKKQWPWTSLARVERVMASKGHTGKTAKAAKAPKAKKAVKAPKAPPAKLPPPTATPAATPPAAN